MRNPHSVHSCRRSAISFCCHAVGRLGANQAVYSMMMQRVHCAVGGPLLTVPLCLPELACNAHSSNALWSNVPVSRFQNQDRLQCCIVLARMPMPPFLPSVT